MLRAGTPYGPGEPPRKVIPAFLRQAAQGLPLRVAAGGTAAFNFVHVADVADCVARAVGGGPAGIYNVASGEHTALRELAQAVAALYPPGRVAVEIAPPVPGAFAGFPPLSVERARATWGFAPRPLAIGLRDYQRSLAAESAA
jgi:nucleoside-diphosphate-sugar epimerase